MTKCYSAGLDILGLPMRLKTNTAAYCRERARLSKSKAEVLGVLAGGYVPAMAGDATEGGREKAGRNKAGELTIGL